MAGAPGSPDRHVGGREFSECRVLHPALLQAHVAFAVAAGVQRVSLILGQGYIFPRQLLGGQLGRVELVDDADNVKGAEKLWDVTRDGTVRDAAPLRLGAD